MMRRVRRLRIGGIHEDGLFGVLPGWVDGTKAPGTTSQTSELGFGTTMRNIVTLRYFFLSPNLVWFGMACGMHWFYPYAIHQATTWSAAWVAHRLAFNFTVAFAYYSFFHLGLYSHGWAARKYVPGSYPTAGNMVHNLYYWSLGVIQWTAWECVVMRLWATGVVPYASDAEVLGSGRLLAWNLFWVMVVPLWRDLHFYGTEAAARGGRSSVEAVEAAAQHGDVRAADRRPAWLWLWPWLWPCCGCGYGSGSGSGSG